MNSKDYQANGYGHDLNLLIILHYCVFHIMQEVGVERKIIHPRRVYLTNKQNPNGEMFTKVCHANDC